ncbi:oligosaccharide translocation protein RFT1 [Rhypophila sp. PSN 637]
MAKDETASHRAAQGASLLILLQVISRAITFIANQLLLRFLTAQLLGVSTQLEVYYLSVIFFARESLRVAVQRQDSPSKKDGQNDEAKATQAVVNLGYLAIGLGIPCAVGFGWLYLHSLSTETLASTPYLVPSLYIYALAAVIELISEPAFVVMQTRLQFSTRATAESVATFLRCTVTLGSAIWGATMAGEVKGQGPSSSLRLGVLPFALGQISYGIGLLAVYTWYGSGLARREGFSLLPRRISPSSPSATKEKRSTETEFALSYFYRPTLHLASSLMAQSIVKQILTQGDTLMVSILSTPTAQGIYALANNYGGLIARLVFQPIEESSRSYFSKLLASSSSTEQDAQSNSNVKQALASLTSLLKIYTLFSIIILPIAPHAAPLLLTIVAGKQWSTPVAANTLSLYTMYIPLLAINGITEAFVSSVATKSQVHAQSGWMSMFSVVFGVAGFVFLRVLHLGAEGLVYTNGINMLCRIVWSGWFITGYFAQKAREAGAAGQKEKGWDEMEIWVHDLLPRQWLVPVALVTWQAVKRVPVFLGQISFLRDLVGTTAPVGAKEALVQLVGMAVVSLPFVGLVLFSERHFLLQGYRSFTSRS